MSRMRAALPRCPPPPVCAPASTRLGHSLFCKQADPASLLVKGSCTAPAQPLLLTRSAQAADPCQARPIRQGQHSVVKPSTTELARAPPHEAPPAHRPSASLACRRCIARPATPRLHGAI